MSSRLGEIFEDKKLVEKEEMTNDKVQMLNEVQSPNDKTEIENSLGLMRF